MFNFIKDLFGLQSVEVEALAAPITEGKTLGGNGAVKRSVAQKTKPKKAPTSPKAPAPKKKKK